MVYDRTPCQYNEVPHDRSVVPRPGRSIASVLASPCASCYYTYINYTYTGVAALHTNLRSDADEPKPVRWGQERRLEFIDFRLFWDGRINRSELVQFFGISIPQASLDIARYMQSAPKNLKYDRSQKAYRATRDFKPAYILPDSQSFLNQFVAVSVGTLPSSFSFIGWQPPYEIVQHPTRAIRPEFLRSVMWAIRDVADIELSYQSMRDPAPSRRWISPHAVAFDGSRWHVRAWCHQNGDFRDFVFARIQQVYRSRKSEINSKSDTLWNTQATIILKPRIGLTKQQRLAIEKEYEMKNGALRLVTRKALVAYVARQLRLDRNEELPPAMQPLQWVNENEFKQLLNAARK